MENGALKTHEQNVENWINAFVVVVVVVVWLSYSYLPIREL